MIEKKDKIKNVVFVMSFIMILLGSVSIVNGNGVEDFLNKIGIKINKDNTENREFKISNETSNNVENKKITIIDEESAVIDTVKNSSDSVVSIVVSKDVPKYKEIMNNPFGDLFNNSDFFNDFNFGGFTQRVPTGETEKKEVGGGTGFIVSDDGFVVTNKHVVVDEKASYSIVLNDGKTYDLDILARDVNNDVAICKIKDLKDKLKPLVLGDSKNIQLGQTVIAIGNALAEYRNTVTKGIVSGIGRKITAGDGFGSSEDLENVIQTDAAINPGNSGGPLLNLSGEVIGINTAINAAGQSIGFAIPINSVKYAIESVKKNGKIITPFLGIRYVQITEDFAKKNNLKYDYGIIVLRGSDVSDLAVIPGSPADKAGIIENDIILELNEKKINKDFLFAKEISNYKVGDKIKLKVFKKGKIEDIDVVLEERK